MICTFQSIVKIYETNFFPSSNGKIAKLHTTPHHLVSATLTFVTFFSLQIVLFAIGFVAFGFFRVLLSIRLQNKCITDIWGS